MIAVILKNKMIKISYRHKDIEENKYCIKINTMNEFLALFKSTKNWYNRSEDSNDIYTPYIENSNTAKVFETIYISHLKRISRKQVEKDYHDIKNIKIDYNAKINPNIEGTSKLILLDKANMIKIVRKKPKDKTTKNAVLITNDTREHFFKDCKETSSYSIYNKFEIHKKLDSEQYEKWKHLLNAIFEKQYIESKIYD